MKYRFGLDRPVCVCVWCITVDALAGDGVTSYEDHPNRAGLYMESVMQDILVIYRKRHEGSGMGTDLHWSGHDEGL